MLRVLTDIKRELAEQKRVAKEREDDSKDSVDVSITPLS